VLQIVYLGLRFSAINSLLKVRVYGLGLSAINSTYT
jgi:hypothetical protein